MKDENVKDVKMFISPEAYLMMQNQLLVQMAPNVEGFVNVEYVKAHIDKLMEANKCAVRLNIALDR